MSFCKDCGTELKENVKFCPKCGTPSNDKQVIYRTKHPEEKACFGPSGSGGGLWGAISFGVFVIGLGILWLLDYFWPGILFLIGIMIIIGTAATYLRRTQKSSDSS